MLWAVVFLQRPPCPFELRPQLRMFLSCAEGLAWPSGTRVTCVRVEKKKRTYMQ